MSMENTNGDTGVKIIANEPFENERGSGQFTHKEYNLGRYFILISLVFFLSLFSKVPKLVASLLPSGSLIMEEKSWNCFPFCRTGNFIVYP